MRRLSAIAFLILIAGLSRAHAAGPSEIFGTILGEIGRQIENKQHTKQQKKQLRRLRRLWTACSKGKLTACDSAAQFPNLTNEARGEILRMREAAEQRPAYERNFYACQEMNRDACQAALSYSYASDVDRANLYKWQRVADQEHQRALAKFRQDERNCHTGSIAACNDALSQRHLEESATAGLQRQRARLQFAQGQRQLEEQQREAALLEYKALHARCVAGERPACETAAAHPQASNADITFLNRRVRELTPITARIANLVTDTQTSGTSAGISIDNLLLALLGGLTLIAAMAGAHQGLQNRVVAALFTREEPPRLEPEPSAEPQPHFSEQMFPLTGHMPTDVRRALYGEQQ